MLNNWHKKEKPIQGLMGFGGGATGNLVRAGGGGGFGGTGGTNTVDSGGYRYHFFRYGGPDTFTVNPNYGGDATGLEILVIAGGGGGGNRTGGGGGAGGIAFAQNIPVNTIPDSVAGTDIPISVGDYVQSGASGDRRGGNTVFAPGAPYEVFAYGGGSGGTDGQTAAGGGSGGGSHYNATVGGATQPGENVNKPWVTNYGHPGSNGYTPHPWESGGGGGAGSRGVDATPGVRGTGGDGQLFPTFPSPIFVPNSDPWYSNLNGRGDNQCRYGGGGGGGSHPPHSPPNHPTAASAGGGAVGGPTSGNVGGDAIHGTGGGGGGATNGNGGAGAYGMIALRYPIA